MLSNSLLCESITYGFLIHLLLDIYLGCFWFGAVAKQHVHSVFISMGQCAHLQLFPISTLIPWQPLISLFSWFTLCGHFVQLRLYNMWSLCLTSIIQPNVTGARPCCSVCQYFAPFFSLVDSSQIPVCRFYLFTRWWTFEFFLLFGYCKKCYCEQLHLSLCIDI